MFNQDQSNDPWQSAADIAASIASEDGTEVNVDPLSRSSIEKLTRVAELQVAGITSITLPHKVTIKSVSKAEWSRASLKSYKPFFERFGEALAKPAPQEQAMSSDPMFQMISQLMKSLAPIMVATTAGSMLGHIGLNALGQYDLPVPRKTEEILVVPNNIKKLANKLEIPVEEAQLWILIHEYLAHAILSTPHIQTQMENLLIDFASAFTPNTELIENQFGSMDDLSQLGEMNDSFGSPEAILSLMRSPAQDLLIPQLDALVSMILGFVDYSMDEICTNLIPSHTQIQQATFEELNEENQSDHFMKSLLGLEINGQTRQRGRSFIDGIHERAGQEGLKRLLTNDLDLPTKAEIDAPGLWLARIGHGTGQDSIYEVPDDLSGLEDLE